MEKNWLTLYSDSFLWIKSESGYIYNTKNHDGFSFDLSSKKTREKCDELLIAENLYTVEITGEDFTDNNFSKWINSLMNIDAGYLTPIDGKNKKPVSLFPIFKIQDNINYYKWQHDSKIGGDVINNLHELIIHINGSETGNNSYSKQTIYPLETDKCLDAKKVLTFIRNADNPFLSQINLVGNIFSYFQYKELIDKIQQFGTKIIIHITAIDFLNNFHHIKNGKWDNIVFNILIESVSVTDRISHFIQDVMPAFFITFFIFSEKDYEILSNKMIGSPSLQNNQFIPLYNGENIDFFEKNVYLDKDEIKGIKLSKRQIFMKQTLNVNYFGKLTLFPDEFIYADVNEPSLGTINNSVYEMVFEEFVRGKSWLRIRDHHPCNNCVYQWLCPSPSNYEKIFLKNNLCNI